MSKPELWVVEQKRLNGGYEPRPLTSRTFRFQAERERVGCERAAPDEKFRVARYVREGK